MTFRSHARSHLLRVSVLASLLAARPVLAGEGAAADVLFEDAKKLAQAGRYAEACPGFEASYKLDPTLGTLLNKADCHEKIGKLATAWTEWGEAAELARKLDDPRQEFATKRRAALTPRLSKLTLVVQAPQPELTVLLDGAPMDAATFGVALPVDAGEHLVVVKRGEQVLKEEHARTADGSAARIALDLAAIGAAAPWLGPEGGEKGAAQPLSNRFKIVGLLVGGAGVATLAVAGVLELMAIAAKPEASACPGDVCSPAGFDEGHRAERFATAGQWVGVGGLTLTIAGGTLLLAGRAARPSPSATAAPSPSGGAWPAGAWLSPWAGPGCGGVVLGGRL